MVDKEWFFPSPQGSELLEDWGRTTPCQPWVTTMVQILFQRSKALFMHWCYVGQEEAMVGALQVLYKWVRI